MPEKEHIVNWEIAYIGIDRVFDCFSIVRSPNSIARCQKFDCSARLANFAYNPLIYRAALATGSVSVLGWEHDWRVIRLWSQVA